MSYATGPSGDVYLADRTQRTTSVGAQLNQACRTSGAVHCSSRWWPALYSLHLMRKVSLFGPSWYNGLITSPGVVVARCLSGEKPERTREVTKLQLLLDGDAGQQKPYIWQQFLCSGPDSGILGSVTEYRRLTRESGLCRWRFKAHDNLLYCSDELL